ncbi:acyl-CoA thioester hydrolase/BAAT C-terminal domain-containing protein [Candidatus Kapabacteria bacterium]|nr:acyl-CoA thioester hydrolase/BAAT C-terminal domain-containing protein [Candidatus Kapabacteria bacterium]
MKSMFLHLIILIIISTNLVSQSSRPQEPKKPFNYKVENITFENKIDSITLAGTLTYPKVGSNFPAVILISGSGAQDRNSELLGHKPFLVIADYLTRNGIAVLRVDDRETGQSGGIYNETGLRGFTNDTKFAFDYLKSHKNFQKSKIGLIGHSLGGVIAPIISSENEDISFIVLLAGSGIRGDKLMLLQKETIERKMGVSEIGINQGQNNLKGAYNIILESNDSRQNLEKELANYFTGLFGKVLPESQISALSKQLSIPWLKDFIKFDPENFLSKTKCPVLAVNGSNDLQVPPEENLAAINDILTKNGNTDFETIQLKNLNHLFQESKTGLPNEYATIEQTFSPQALKVISDWILVRTNK